MTSTNRKRKRAEPSEGQKLAQSLVAPLFSLSQTGRKLSLYLYVKKQEAPLGEREQTFIELSYDFSDGTDGTNSIGKLPMLSKLGDKIDSSVPKNMFVSIKNPDECYRASDSILTCKITEFMREFLSSRLTAYRRFLSQTEASSAPDIFCMTQELRDALIDQNIPGNAVSSRFVNRFIKETSKTSPVCGFLVGIDRKKFTARQFLKEYEKKLSNSRDAEDLDNFISERKPKKPKQTRRKKDIKEIADPILALISPPLEDPDETIQQSIPIENFPEPPSTLNNCLLQQADNTPAERQFQHAHEAGLAPQPLSFPPSPDRVVSGPLSPKCFFEGLNEDILSGGDGLEWFEGVGISGVPEGGLEECPNVKSSTLSYSSPGDRMDDPNQEIPYRQDDPSSIHSTMPVSSSSSSTPCPPFQDPYFQQHEPQYPQTTPPPTFQLQPNLTETIFQTPIPPNQHVDPQQQQLAPAQLRVDHLASSFVPGVQNTELVYQSRLTQLGDVSSRARAEIYRLHGVCETMRLQRETEKQRRLSAEVETQITIQAKRKAERNTQFAIGCLQTVANHLQSTVGRSPGDHIDQCLQFINQQKSVLRNGFEAHAAIERVVEPLAQMVHESSSPSSSSQN